jgi:hypothetical protein
MRPAVRHATLCMKGVPKMNRQTVPTLAALVGAACAAFGSTAVAHHGGGGRYDASRPIYLPGTVLEASFTPPHPLLRIAVERADPPALDAVRRADFSGDVIVREQDVGSTLVVEFAPISMFFGLRDRIAAGDRVEVIAMRNCDSPHQLRSQWIRLRDGELVMRTGGNHRKVDGC